MEHDIIAQLLILLGNYVVQNADTLAGKVVGLAPVVLIPLGGFLGHHVGLHKPQPPKK